MKRAVLVFSAFALVSGLCLVGYMALAPQALLRGELVKAVRKASGRELAIEGGASVSLAPAFAVTFRGVGLGAPPDMPGDSLMRVDSVRVEADFWPLLLGRVKIRRVTLDRPALELLVDPQGRRNWEFRARDSSPPAGRSGPTQARDRFPAENQNPARVEPGEADPSHGAAAGRGQPLRLALHHTGPFDGAELVIERGAGVFRDQSRREAYAVSDLSLSAHWPVSPGSAGAEGQFFAQGRFVAQGRDVAFKASAETLEGLLGGGAPITAEVSSGPFAAEVSGRLAVNKGGLPGVNYAGFVKAAVAGAGGVAGELEISGASGADGTPRAVLKPTSLNYHNVTAQGGVISVMMKDGGWVVRLDDVGIYGGKGRGDLTIGARQDGPVVSGAVTIANASALPLLADASRFDWLSGAANLSLKFTGGGATAAETLQSLAGEAHLSLENGALEGLDLPKMLRSAQDGKLRWSRNADEKTGFDHFAATFAIAGGAARTSDLSLTGANVHMTGDGSVDFVHETLDFRLKPRITAAAGDAAGRLPAGRQGASQQGASQQSESGASQGASEFIEVPLAVRGAWGKPRIEPDVNRMLADPASAATSARTLAKPIEKLTGGAIKSEDVGKAIEALFGKKKPKKPEPAETRPQ